MMFWTGPHKHMIFGILTKEGVPCELTAGGLEIKVEPQKSRGMRELYHTEKIIIYIEHGVCGEVRIFDRKSKLEAVLGAFNGPDDWSTLWQDPGFDPEELITEGPTLRVVGY